MKYCWLAAAPNWDHPQSALQVLHTGAGGLELCTTHRSGEKYIELVKERGKDEMAGMGSLIRNGGSCLETIPSKSGKAETD